MSAIVINKTRVDVGTKRRFRNFLCCCREESTKIDEAHQNYEYVVEKLVIKRVPVANQNRNVTKIPKGPEHEHVDPVVLKSLCRLSPENFVPHRKRHFVPAHVSCRGSGDHSPPERMKMYNPVVGVDTTSRYKANRNVEDLPLKLETVYHHDGSNRNEEHRDTRENQGKYLLKKIASDISNQKDVKWKIIIKQKSAPGAHHKPEPPDDIITRAESFSSLDYYTTDYSQ